MSLTSGLSTFARKTGISMDQIHRKVLIDLTGDLVKVCPVDTGYARSNFFFGMSRVTTTSDAGISKNGAPSTQRALDFASKVRAGGVCYITNNVPYILKIIEYGSSDQCASGGLTRVVARWQEIVDGAAKGVRSGRVESGRGL
jgi:hypothetical protein